jgi:hypothetical protein
MTLEILLFRYCDAPLKAITLRANETPVKPFAIHRHGIVARRNRKTGPAAAQLGFERDTAFADVVG